MLPDAAPTPESSSALGPATTGDAAQRYARQVVLPDFGEAAQRQLSEAAVLVVGAGGLGSPVLTYLAAAGIGRITIADDDEVATHNLARQVLYGPSDVGRPKVEAAAGHLTRLNPTIRITPIPRRVTTANSREILRDFPVVVDASDNAETRYLLNDTALALGATYVWGAIGEYAGRASVARAGHGPCFRCLFPEPPAPGPGGVFGPVCAVIGGWMAGEALAVAAGVREAATGALFQVDLWHAAAQVISVKSGISCRSCRPVQ